MNSGELKVNVPLAQMESEEDEEESTLKEDLKSSMKNPNSVSTEKSKKSQNLLNPKSRSASANRARASPRFQQLLCEGTDTESMNNSLEDLVGNFDEKLSKVFQDYKESANKIAPVQVRSHEEIMNECQVWWTITGNFGNMAPLDWTKSTTRAKYLPTLNLNKPNKKSKKSKNQSNFAGGGGGDSDLEEEDDIVAADLDMHSLIISSNPQESAPVQSADDVIKEIDDLIEEEEEAEEEENRQDQASRFFNEHHGGLNSFQRSSRLVSSALAGRKLDELSLNELNQILSDIEALIKELSEELVSDLGLRDELEYEKELKNTFISLLLSIQSKRRQIPKSSASGPAKKGGGLLGGVGGGSSYKYLTTVIPYQPDRGAPPLQTLQVLVKILKSINEDSPAVPALLTDYILKVLCPS